MGKELSINVSVKFDEERLQKAIEVFEREVSECFTIEIGRKNKPKDTTNEPCVKCGSVNHTESKLYADDNNDEPLHYIKTCDECGYSIELPTRLEGSD